jgi:hypothetical protein
METDTSTCTDTGTGVQIRAAFPFDVVDAGGHAEGGPGRHVVARVPLDEGAVVLAADAFVVGVFDSQRKRVCCGCAEVVPRRLACEYISSSFARFLSYFYSATLPDRSFSSGGRTAIRHRPPSGCGIPKK